MRINSVSDDEKTHPCNDRYSQREKHGSIAYHWGAGVELYDFAFRESHLGLPTFHRHRRRRGRSERDRDRARLLYLGTRQRKKHFHHSKDRAQLWSYPKSRARWGIWRRRASARFSPAYGRRGIAESNT